MAKNNGMRAVRVNQNSAVVAHALSHCYHIVGCDILIVKISIIVALGFGRKE